MVLPVTYILWHGSLYSKNDLSLQNIQLARFKCDIFDTMCINFATLEIFTYPFAYKFCKACQFKEYKRNYTFAVFRQIQN